MSEHTRTPHALGRLLDETANAFPNLTTEAEMQRGLMYAARQLGFMVFHAAYSIGSEKGFPDVVAVGYGRCFVFELKGPRGRASAAQKAWIGAFQAAGIAAMFVWPEDIEQALHLLLQAYEEAREV